MRIYGLDKFSLLDYPGKVSAIVFLAGCNMNCSYCYNSDLITYSESNYTEEEILEFLKSRIGKIDGVVITGGEPTIQKDLPEFIKKIKKLGLLVKLDTNGTNPLMLEELINKDLIDYIAMDIKTRLTRYSEVTNTNINVENILKSIKLINLSNIEHEFRTTVYNIHTEEDLVEIAKLVTPSKYFLQEFMRTEKVLNKFIFSPDENILEKYVNTCSSYTLTYLRKK